MNYWSRDNTKDWIHKVEGRIEDFDYYLQRTVEWCENNGVFEERKVLMCSLITCIWVASMRGEKITFQELVELVGMSNFDDKVADKVYDICTEFQNLDHEEVLQILISKSTDSDSSYIDI